MLEEPRKRAGCVCVPPQLLSALEWSTTWNHIFFPSRARSNLWEVSTQKSSVASAENLPTFTHIAEMREQL